MKDPSFQAKIKKRVKKEKNTITNEVILKHEQYYCIIILFLFLGAFLIPYFIFMIIEGLPLFFIEFAIGQRFRTAALSGWGRVSPALRGLGWSCIVVSCFLCVYYIVVLAWCIYYFLYVIYIRSTMVLKTGMCIP